MSATFIDTSQVYPSNISLTMGDVTTELFNFNTTFETPVFPPRPSIVYFVAWFLAVIIGNCTAIAILIRNRRTHKWKIFYRLVLILAVTDFIGQVITIPIIFASYASRDILVTGGKLCNCMSMTIITTSVMSVLLVCLLAIERFIAVRHPIIYRNNIRIRHMYFAVACVFAISLTVGLLPTIGVNTHMLQNNEWWCFINLKPTEPKDRVVLFLCAFIGIAAFLLMLIMNGFVIHELYHLYKRKTSSESQQTVQSFVLDVKNLQNITFLTLIMIAFIVTWMPFIVICFSNAVGTSVFGYESTKLAVKFTLWHQILNPWIYIIIQDCLFSRLLQYGRKHSKRGGFFHRVFEDNGSKQHESDSRV